MKRLTTLTLAVCACAACAWSQEQFKDADAAITYASENRFTAGGHTVYLCKDGVMYDDILIPSSSWQWKSTFAPDAVKIAIPLQGGDEINITVRHGAIIDNGCRESVVYSDVARGPRRK